MGCGAKELGIFGDAAGVWNFLVAFREASWNFPRQDHDFKEFHGFRGMELGIFRVAKSSGEGRGELAASPQGNAHAIGKIRCLMFKRLFGGQPTSNVLLTHPLLVWVGWVFIVG